MDMVIRPNAGMLLPEDSSIVLAGETFAVGELTVRDIAAVERLFTELVGHPYAGLEDSVREARATSPDDPAWLDRQAVLVTAAEEWPPSFASDLFWETLATPGGMLAFLWVILKRYRPTLRPAESFALAASMSAEDWLALDRIAWGLQPWEDLSARGGGGEVEAQGIDWPRTFAFLAEHRGLGPAEVATLTLTQLNALLAPENGRKVAIREQD